MAWALALYFGCQSMVAYVVFGWLAEILTDAGMTDTAAAFQVGIAITVGIPLAMFVPPLLGRLRRPAILVVALASCYLAAFLGLMLIPGQLVVVFSVLIGIGTGAFPLALTLIALRSRTSMATTSLSAFTQCCGYLIASVGPFGFRAAVRPSAAAGRCRWRRCAWWSGSRPSPAALRSGRGSSRTNSKPVARLDRPAAADQVTAVSRAVASGRAALAATGEAEAVGRGPGHRDRRAEHRGQHLLGLGPARARAAGCWR